MVFKYLLALYALARKELKNFTRADDPTTQH